MYVCYDSVTVSEIPKSASCVLGYVGPEESDNIYVTMPALRKGWRKARKIEVAAHPKFSADFLDVETYDAVPADFPEWHRRMIRQGRWKPGFYASKSVIPSIVRLCEDAAIPRSAYRILSAHYMEPAIAHICRPHSCGATFVADGTQWTDRALGRNLDESLLSSGFFKLPVKRPTRTVHPKVIGATTASALLTSVLAVIHSIWGTHLTPVEVGYANTIVASLAGYATPSTRRPR